VRFKALRVYQRYQNERGYQPHKAPLKQVQPSRLYSQSLFKIFPIVYQKSQSERDDLLYTNQAVELLSIQLDSQSSFSSLFNSFISMRILPALSRFSKTPIKDNTKTNQALKRISRGKDKLNKAVKLPPKPALKSSNLSLMMEYSSFNNSIRTFKSSLITRAFISADHIFDAIKCTFKGICFDVVIKPTINPFRNFIFSFPSDTNRFWIKSTDISKLFYSEITPFKSLFKGLKIHYNPLKVNILSNYITIELIKLALSIDLKTKNIIQSKIRKLIILAFYYSNPTHPKQTPSLTGK